MVRPGLLLGGLFDWRGLQDAAPIYSSFWNEYSHSLNCLPLQMEAWMTQSWNAPPSRYVQKMSFPFLPFALGSLGRSLGLQLLLFVLNQLQKHFLKVVYRFLLGINHIKLITLNLDLLFRPFLQEFLPCM